MKNTRTRYLAITLLSPAQLWAACTNSARPAWETFVTNLNWGAPSVLSALVIAILLLVLGDFEGHEDQKRYLIVTAAIGVLIFGIHFGSAVFGESAATV